MRIRIQNYVYKFIIGLCILGVIFCYFHTFMILKGAEERWHNTENHNLNFHYHQNLEFNIIMNEGKI